MVQSYSDRPRRYGRRHSRNGTRRSRRGNCRHSDLGWLGIQSFRAQGALGVGKDNHTVSPFKGFSDALITNLLNPKVIVLFLALLPNFLDTTKSNVTAQLFMLTAGLIVINTVWQIPMALLGKLARDWLERPKVQRTINLTTGAILLVFSILMVYENIIAES